jgi:hypothetical protein
MGSDYSKERGFNFAARRQCNHLKSANLLQRPNSDLTMYDSESEDIYRTGSNALFYKL